MVVGTGVGGIVRLISSFLPAALSSHAELVEDGAAE